MEQISYTFCEIVSTKIFSSPGCDANTARDAAFSNSPDSETPNLCVFNRMNCDDTLRQNCPVRDTSLTTGGGD